MARLHALRNGKLAHLPLWAVLGVGMILAILTWPNLERPGPARDREVQYLPLPQPAQAEPTEAAAPYSK